MPIKFWGDDDGQKYHNAYFTKFKNIWHHGDFIERTDKNGFIMRGRSDATLNPGGVRMEPLKLPTSGGYRFYHRGTSCWSRLR